MITQFCERTADEVWCAAARHFCCNAVRTGQDSRFGRTDEVLHSVFEISDPRQRWVYSRTPPISPAFAIAEVIWILAGMDESAFVNYWNPQLPKFQGTGPTYRGAYGHRLRTRFGIDQLETAYNALCADRDSRRVVLQIYSAEHDLVHAANHDIKDVPCNVCSFLKIRDGRLEWTQVMRSNDLHYGVPYNFVQFTTLQEVMAGWLGVAMGNYVHFSDSLHVYDRNRKDVRSFIVQHGVSNEDHLALERQQFAEALDECLEICNAVRADSLTKRHFGGLLDRNHLPASYRNLMSVLLAYAARKRDWHEEESTAIAVCTNAALQELWIRWTSDRDANRKDR